MELHETWCETKVKLEEERLGKRNSLGTQVYIYIMRTIFKQNHVGSKSCLKLSISNL